MTNSMTSKEALFALDTTFDEDMTSIKTDVTNRAIKYINSTPRLYKITREYGSVEEVCRSWAEEHDDEFGELFITELGMVDWDKVEEML